MPYQTRCHSRKQDVRSLAQGSCKLVGLLVAVLSSLHVSCMACLNIG